MATGNPDRHTNMQPRPPRRTSCCTVSAAQFLVIVGAFRGCGCCCDASDRGCASGSTGNDLARDTGLARVTTRSGCIINSWRARSSALIDRSTPRTRCVALGLDKRLEPLKISLCLVLDDVELVANLLNETLGLILQAQIHPGLPTTYVFESDRTGIRGTLRSCPGDLAIRHLLQDLRLPLPAYTGDFSNPFQAVVAAAGSGELSVHCVRPDHGHDVSWSTQGHTAIAKRRGM